MKVTKARLKEIIREEVAKMKESLPPWHPGYKKPTQDRRVPLYAPSPEPPKAGTPKKEKEVPPRGSSHIDFRLDEEEAPTYYALVEDVEGREYILSDKDMEELRDEAKIYGFVKAIFTANIIEGEL
jgi:hypothetical protein